MSNYYQELQNDEWVDVAWDDDKAYGPIEFETKQRLQGVSSVGGDALMTQRESWEKSGKPEWWTVIGGGGYTRCRTP